MSILFIIKIMPTDKYTFSASAFHQIKAFWILSLVTRNSFNRGPNLNRIS